MSNQIAERTIITVVTSSKCKMAALIFIQSLQILCGKENSVDQHSILLRTELQQTYLKQAFAGHAFVTRNSNLTTRPGTRLDARQIGGRGTGNM